MSKILQVIVCILAFCLIAVWIGRQAAENRNNTMRIQNLEYRVNYPQADPCYPGENSEVCYRRIVNSK